MTANKWPKHAGLSLLFAMSRRVALREEALIDFMQRTTREKAMLIEARRRCS